MAVRTSKPQQMAVVTLGYRDYLLPQASALKVLDLMSQALEVDSDFSSRKQRYRVGEAPEVSLVVVKSDQLDLPKSELAPASSRARKPLLLN
ncbi:hypothetical protein [Pseudomonas sp. WS 5059]|uniref:hypothetical protein n=1 Tax=Pseudomonas sp. WS 5059 TaxID=2717491 RepID=UPI001CA44CC5|nr:hypothetical protein [Pseudomonas sp. WS 5059]